MDSRPASQEEAILHVHWIFGAENERAVSLETRAVQMPILST